MVRDSSDNHMRVMTLRPDAENNILPALRPVLVARAYKGKRACLLVSFP